MGQPVGVSVSPPVAQSVIIISQPQPIVQQQAQYVPRRSNLCPTLCVLYFAAIWIIIGVTTPGWRRVVYRTDRNPTNGIVTNSSTYSYQISVGVGLYEYKQSYANWQKDTQLPPVVGYKGTGIRLPIFGDCTARSNYNFLDSADCQTYHTLQALGVVVLIFAPLTPLILHLAVVDNEKKMFGQRGMMAMIVILTAFMIAMFFVSERVTWSDLNPDPILGSMRTNMYGFAYGFFCVGFIFLALADVLFLCAMPCES